MILYYTPGHVAKIFDLPLVTVHSHIACGGLKSSFPTDTAGRRKRSKHRFSQEDLFRYELFLSALEDGEKKDDAVGHLSEFSFAAGQDYWVYVWGRRHNGKRELQGCSPWENGKAYTLKENEERYEVINLGIIKKRVLDLIKTAMTSGEIEPEFINIDET